MAIRVDFSGILFARRDSGLYMPVSTDQEGVNVHIEAHCSVQPNYIVDPRPQLGQIIVPPAQVYVHPEITVNPTPVQIVVKSATYRLIERVRDRWNTAVFFMGSGTTGVITVIGVLLLVAIIVMMLSLPLIFGMHRQTTAAAPRMINRNAVMFVYIHEASTAPAANANQSAGAHLANGVAPSQTPKTDGWVPCPQGMVSVYTVIGVGRDGLRVRSEANSDAKVVATLPEGSVVYRDLTNCFVSPTGLWVPVTFYPAGDVERSGYISAPIYLKPGIVKP